jgi:hypothetical protein
VNPAARIDPYDKTESSLPFWLPALTQIKGHQQVLSKNFF